jgi:hypothetical protein
MVDAIAAIPTVVGAARTEVAYISDLSKQSPHVVGTFRTWCDV